ncbi:MAG: hypothetical protein FWD28_01620 [Treponema sp.]|nr:hypothetical protein [Treponema sp.]
MIDDYITDAQNDWTIQLFLEYFPYVFYPPFEILKKYFRFDKDEIHKLPSHMQYFLKPNPLPIMGFDILSMLRDNLFLSLIKGNYLVELYFNKLLGQNKDKFISLNKIQEDNLKKELRKQAKLQTLENLIEKAKKECFNIQEYLINIDEEVFSDEFEKKYQRFNFNESVPELFFNIVDSEKIYGEYNIEEKCFEWDLSSISFHKPKNIYAGYRRFAHSVYTILGFTADNLQNREK